MSRSPSSSCPAPRRAAVAAGVALIALSTRAARAQAPDPLARADAAFNEGQRLHAAGDDAAACPKFEESRRIAPAVGVSLHLADCYARTGRSASAWREFRDAEKMARDKGDAKRADLAAQRAAALAPNLSRLTVEVPSAAAGSGEQLTLDGAPLTPEAWNTPTPVDPGDHTVVVTAPGQPSRTLTAHVDGGGSSVTLPTGVSTVPAAPAFIPIGDVAAPNGPEAAAPPEAHAPQGALAPTAERAPRRSSSGSTARWIGVGLMTAGVVGVGVGTYLATYKTRDMDNGQLCEPHLLPHAIPEAAVAFSVGGLALVTGAVLFVTHWPGRAEISLGPTVLPGGGGSVLRGTF